MTTTDDARPAARRPGRVQARVQSRLLDRLFLGGCTLLYLGLVASVIAALRMLGGG